MVALRSHLTSTFGAYLLIAGALGCESSPRPQVPPPFPSPITPALDAGVATTAVGTTTVAGSRAVVSRPPMTGEAPTLTPPPVLMNQCFECVSGCMDCNDGRGCVCDGAPEADPWDPPFAEVGAPGFGNSTEPLCATAMQPFGFDLWSDERGVFALVSGEVSFSSFDPVLEVDEDAGVTAHPSATVAGVTTVSTSALTQLWSNDGNGWRVLLNAYNAQSNFGLRGAPGGWLAMFDRGLPEAATMNSTTPGLMTSCTVGLLQHRDLNCFDFTKVPDLTVVAGNLAHVISGDSRLVTYDGERWHATTPLLPFPASRLWADASNVLALGPLGTAMWLQQDSWMTQDTGTVEHFTAVWGAARNDVWAGTAQGSIYHYDGTAWTKRGALGGESCDAKPAINGIWGSGDQVYFTSSAQFARWTGSKIESLGNWACNLAGATQLITGMWGRAPDEVFLALVDSFNFGNSRCAPAFVVRYDGKEFHRM